MDEKGYTPGGPGTPSSGSRAGGSYGGLGGRGGSGTYDTPSTPFQPGSAGQGQSAPYTGTGHGGGGVRIEATGRVTVDGIITANGRNPNGGDQGGGSGGGIYIVCDTFAGSGVVRANGASVQHEGAEGVNAPDAGGGGRIAVIYNVTNQQAVSPKPTVSFSARNGLPTQTYLPNAGTLGTLYFPDDQLLPESMDTSFNGVIYGFKYWTAANVMADGALLQFGTNDFELDVSNTALFRLPPNYAYRPTVNLSRLTAGGDVVVGNTVMALSNNSPTFLCGGNVFMESNTILTVWSSPTNGTSLDYGALVAVTGSIVLASNAWIYPRIVTNDGGAPLFLARNVFVTNWAGFHATTNGFWPSGPGTPSSGSRGGGGHGGQGGTGYGPGGPTYGSADSPILPGSPGQAQSQSYGGGQGGGVIRIQAERTIRIDGALEADGRTGGFDSGGGSGGSIFLSCRWLEGSTSGVISARGGNASQTVNAGDGGGGRIAVAYGISTNGWRGSLDTNSVMPGTNRPASGAQYGTLVWRTFSTGPLVDNLPASNVSYVSAILAGLLVSTGSEPPTTVAVYWDTEDRGTTAQLWAHTNVFSGPFTDGQLLTNEVTGLSDGQSYAYRFYAANVFGDYWASPAAVFSTLLGIPTVSNNGGASNVTLSSADLCGSLIATGTAATGVEVLWGPTDGETNREAWAFTNVFAGSQTPGFLVTNIALPASNTFYYYTYHATNSRGESWAAPSELFMAGEIWLETSTANAFEAGQVAGTITVCRVSSATNFAIPIRLSIGGTAELGTDYLLDPSATNLTLQAGVSRLPISVIPVWDSTNEPTESVDLTLLPGPYFAGVSNSATVNIINDAIVPGFNMSVANGSWDTPSAWSLGRRPVAGDVAVVTNAILLTNATEQLVAFTNWGVLTFSNWNARLCADTVVLAAGTLTHASCYGTNQTPLVSNRVHIVCRDLTIESNAAINVDERGYYPFGPGTREGNMYSRYGGSYGGLGGKISASAYGSAETPTDAGSCGGWQSGPGYGGKPGGSVQILASGSVIINGLISANGKKGGFDSGGGSGGGVYIACDTIGGNGTIRANGGPADNSSGGGGGGGRIAVHYNSAHQGGVNPPAALTLSASGGSPELTYYGNLGSIYVTDTQLLPESFSTNWNGVIWNIPSYSPVNLVCSGLIQFAVAAADLVVSNNVSFITPTQYVIRPAITLSNLSAGGSVTLDHQMLVLTNRPCLFCESTLLLTNGATVYIYAAPSNTLALTGALVVANGSLIVSSNCWIYPSSDPTNGASVVFRVGNMTVNAGGGINANQAGYSARYNAPGNGPGAGTAGGTGGGYGGNGGRVGAGAGGYAYGSSNAPAEPGSAGHSQNNSTSGRAGGSIQITASGTVKVEGSLLANGGNAPPFCGAGSGGSIYMTCRKFIGASSGMIQANGGTVANSNYWGCGGGGGRIAIWRSRDVNGQGVVTAEAKGGTGSNGSGPDYNGEDGTIVWGWLQEKGTLFTVR